MGTTQRHLVNLDMLLTDIEMLDASEYGGQAHIRLFKEIQRTLEGLDMAAQQETVSSFQKAVIHAGLAGPLEDKRMPGIFRRLIGNVLEYWEAHTKAEHILNSQFDGNADKRLELLQVKSIKAKSQFKTVARAMGRTDYQHFIEALGLNHEDWQWPA
ncbi:hypothetical protein [Alteromonas lipolytica]|uniref:Uncharacterized protein n=1 Tax=Alteromonas lipolytica TaxID=1856405 RepID=A0A1E8F9M1_9ALTE|nr:hypothetical protein [Alteromonas lipolytica]OFI32318.1 hypothetical protein BFC17_07655 [Alteromonas lipolytica]GGF85517.1 hypothetical protein GCM10011338_42320 [Alteromonas lipolytica]